MTIKTKLIIAGIVLLVAVGVLAYFNYVPFWVRWQPRWLLLLATWQAGR